MSSSSSLNPKAQEFKPMSRPKLLHPHHIFSNSHQPFTITTTQPPLTYYFHWVNVNVSPPPPPQPPLLYHHHHYSPGKVSPAVEDCFYRPFSTGNAKFKGHSGKRQKYPSFGFKRRTFLPPRMERVFGSFLVNVKPKKVWKPASNTTTVMIRNIPNTLRRDFMLKCMDNCCRTYSLEYDFLYLPMDFRRGDNLGYAFVNFTSAAAAKTFMTVFDGFKWVTLNTDQGPITSKKICRIKWARIQGKESLVRRFQCSSFKCDSLEFLPVVLDPPRNGSNANLPPPVVIGQLHHVDN